MEPGCADALPRHDAIDEVAVTARDDPPGTAPMELSHRFGPAGEAVVDLGGDLDILSAELAVDYVRDVIDRHPGPVTVNLTALAFCDARGLAALVRMAGYAERHGRSFRLASPSPSLVKIMRITRLDRRFRVIAGVDLQIGGLDAEPDPAAGPQ